MTNVRKLQLNMKDYKKQIGTIKVKSKSNEF